MTTIKTRGRTFTGVVTSDKMSKTVTVRWERRHYIPKYERYEKRKSIVKAHVPEGMELVVGDIVAIKETRPISKTKNFIVIGKINGDESEKTEEVKKAASKKEEAAKPVKKVVKKTVKKTTKKVAKKAAKKSE